MIQSVPFSQRLRTKRSPLSRLSIGGSGGALEGEVELGKGGVGVFELEGDINGSASTL